MTSRFALLALALVAGMSGCGLPDADATPRTTSEVGPAFPSPTVSPDGPTIAPAPGSESDVYRPNPGAIVVAIDAGHGGCLDWGVPDPSERGVELAEKTMTLGIAQRLRDLLVAEGIGVVMIRDADEALAGDDYPPLGCEGAAWRDVNGDGVAGFGPDVPEATRTRDELQARLDLANLSGADALVSIHINSPSEGGQRIEIAFSETFYTDETPWGPTSTALLAGAVQEGVMRELDPLAAYDRGDRGITAHNLYIVAPPLLTPTVERPDPAKQPTRGGLMPVVLAEVGSITLRAEHDLLASPDGQAAVARGIMEGVADYVGQRELAVRIGVADAPDLEAPSVTSGNGPPFWARVVPGGPVALRLTNTGIAPWPVDIRLVVGWEPSDQPYLAQAPAELVPAPVDVPALEPGASARVEVDLGSEGGARRLAWISLMSGETTLAELGSPALQLSTSAP